MEERKTVAVLFLTGTLFIIGAVAESLHAEALISMISILLLLLLIGFVLFNVSGIIYSMIVSFNHADDDDYISLSPSARRRRRHSWAGRTGHKVRI